MVLLVCAPCADEAAAAAAALAARAPVLPVASRPVPGSRYSAPGAPFLASLITRGAAAGGARGAPRALLLYASRSVFSCVWRITVSTRAMLSRTTLLRTRRGGGCARQARHVDARAGARRRPAHSVHAAPMGGAATHILDSLFGAPPVTLATRSAASSVFSSLSCAHADGRAARGVRGGGGGEATRGADGGRCAAVRGARPIQGREPPWGCGARVPATSALPSSSRATREPWSALRTRKGWTRAVAPVSRACRLLRR